MGTLMRGGNADHNERADQGVADAAAGHAGRRGQFGEQCHAQTLAAANNEHVQHRQQRHDRQHRQSACQHAHGAAEQGPRMAQRPLQGRNIQGDICHTRQMLRRMMMELLRNHLCPPEVLAEVR